ncbi:MAG: hypothetical protein ACK47B_15125 [Armatimonadota bacterium]
MSTERPVDRDPASKSTSPHTDPPACVRILAVGLIFLGMMALVAVAALPVLFLVDYQLGVAGTVIITWILVLARVCLPGLIPGDAGAWAPLMAALFVTSAVTTAGLATSVVTSGLPLLAPGFVSQTAATGSILWLTVSFFQARAWFGIPKREGWSTLRRRGWWSLLLTAAVWTNVVSASSHLRDLRLYFVPAPPPWTQFA